MILQEQQLGHIKGICITKHCPTITHSQFVDDIVLYGEATIQEIQVYNAILKGQ